MITLNKPAKRIVALAPHIVENIFAVGAGDTLVGAVDYCDYPEAAKKIPRVGNSSIVNLEAILAARPDLVIAWRSGQGNETISKLEKLGLAVYVSEPKVLSDVAKSLHDFGVLTGRKAQAEAVVADFESKLNQLRASGQHRETGSNRQRTYSVFYQIWNDPLQTLNGNHIVSDVIRLCGGINAFRDSPALAPKISVESVIARNPDIIIASGMGEQRPEWLEAWRKWPSIKAVEQGNLFFISPDIIQRHTVRILDGAQQMCDFIEGL